jgi:hypothetical protein
MTNRELPTEEILSEIHAQLSSIAAGNEEMLTPEQTAVRLSMTLDQVERRMKKGTLPKGKVWFDRPGIGRYFSWPAVCRFIKDTNNSQDDQPTDPAPHWRRKA